MKAKLAMRLLADMMNWIDAQATEEFSWLKLMVDSKYDHYQGYRPGGRFYVNFLNWIGQFDVEDRATAYRFFRHHLIFISQMEMHHLVNLTWHMMQSEIRAQIAAELELAYYETWGHAASEERLKEMDIRTLYVGLSDGAKIDVFRRDNEEHISNEQIVAASEISNEKWIKLVESLKERLTEANFNEQPASFERICLIDDFTASGTTLIRYDDAKKQWKGKIPTFCSQNKDRIGNDIDENCTMHVHHYLATAKAKDAVNLAITRYKLENPTLKFVTTFSYILNTDIAFDDEKDIEISLLLQKYYDRSIEDSIVGSNIWYGYKSGGLPLILYHNTPNNSVAILWATGKDSENPETRKTKPLFSRKKRHKDNG